MVEETETTEATETQKPGELTAVDETAPKAAPSVASVTSATAPDEEPEPVEVNTKLLEDLPLPAFQRITVLPVGAHVAVVENTRRSLMFVRGRNLLYACGPIAKSKATDVPGELKALVDLCGEGRGGDVFSLGDLLAEVRRRREVN